MAGLALSGLASGVDTDGLVTRIMSLERQALTRAQLRDKAIEGRANGLKEIQSRLANLKGAAEALRKPELWADVQTVTSGDPARVGVSRTGMVPAGGYTIEVRQLAAAEREGFTWATSTEATTLDIDGVVIDVPAGAKPSDLATLINNRGDLPVYATAMDDDTVVFSARKTGTAGAFTVSGAQLTQDPTHTKAARDAEYSLDGGQTWVPTSSHQLEGVIPGMTVTLKGVTTGPVTINAEVAALDKQGVKDRLKAFVTAYNDLVGTTRTKLDEKTFKNPQTDVQAARGQLSGDSGLNSMLSGLRRTVSERVEGMADASAMDELFELGISTGKPNASGVTSADAKQGKLSIDMAKLDAALEDPVKMRRLLGGGDGVDGIAQKIEKLVEREIGTGGVFEQRLKVATAERDRISDANAALEDRLAAKEKRLRAQFAAMENALGKAQSQQGWLSAQLSALI